MIVPLSSQATEASAPVWHARFLEMLPAIQWSAEVAFCRLSDEARQEAVQEAVANALVAFVRLVELGRENVAYSTPLGKFAIRQVRAGRRVGARLNVHELLSPYAQRTKGFRVERLFRFRKDENTWEEIVVKDSRPSVADQVALRLDFRQWQAALSRRDRRIAAALATGRSTSDVARRFQLSPARISQLRAELRRSWQAFQGEPTRSRAARSEQV